MDQLIELEVKARELIEQLHREIKDSEADTAAISPDAAIGGQDLIPAGGGEGSGSTETASS